MSNPLQRKRNAVGLTQAQIAKIVGIDERTYRRYEATAASEPRARMAIRIANALGVVNLRELWDAKTSSADYTTDK